LFLPSWKRDWAAPHEVWRRPRNRLSHPRSSWAYYASLTILLSGDRFRDIFGRGRECIHAWRPFSMVRMRKVFVPILSAFFSIRRIANIWTSLLAGWLHLYTWFCVSIWRLQILHMAEGYLLGMMRWRRCRVGRHLKRNLTRLTCCVIVLPCIARLCAGQSTVWNCSSVQFVFSCIYAFKRGPWRSRIICRFSFDVLKIFATIPPTRKPRPPHILEDREDFLMRVLNKT